MARRTTKRVLVVLHFLGMTVSELLIWAKATIGLLDVDPDIDPVVPVTDLTNQLKALTDTVSERVTNQSKQLTDDKNAELNSLVNSFTYVAGQVEMIANQIFAGDEAAARAFITRLAFIPKKEAVREGKHFRVVKTNYGLAYLETKATERNKRSLYFWRYTINPLDPQSWSQPFVTTGSSIILTGLKNDTRYYFQEAQLILPGRKPEVNVKTSLLSWSDPISGMVV